MTGSARKPKVDFGRRRWKGRALSRLAQSMKCIAESFEARKCMEMADVGRDAFGNARDRVGRGRGIRRESILKTREPAEVTVPRTRACSHVARSRRGAETLRRSTPLLLGAARLRPDDGLSSRAKGLRSRRPLGAPHGVKRVEDEPTSIRGAGSRSRGAARRIRWSRSRRRRIRNRTAVRRGCRRDSGRGGRWPSFWLVAERELDTVLVAACCAGRGTMHCQTFGGGGREGGSARTSEAASSTIGVSGSPARRSTDASRGAEDRGRHDSSVETTRRVLGCRASARTSRTPFAASGLRARASRGRAGPRLP